MAHNICGQEIASILRNPDVHYSVYKRPPLVPLLNQMNTIHALQSQCLRFNLILSSNCA